MRCNTKQLEKSKHEFGDLVVTEMHYPDNGARFYTYELKTSKKALKANPKLPLLLSVTDGTLANAKAGLARALERYLK